jgi:PIN domain nuclease of toxin-antitoxin system
MIAGVADTHAALWYLFGDLRLSAPAKAAFDVAASSRRKIVLSVISLAEVVYLVEKNRLPRASFWFAKWQSTALPHEIHSNIAKQLR